MIDCKDCEASITIVDEGRILYECAVKNCIQEEDERASEDQTTSQ